MKDEQIVKIYEKGIKYQFINNISIAFLFSVFFVLLRIKERENTGQLLLGALIGLAGGLLFILIYTPIQWKSIKKKYEKQKRNS
ncbi:hypothetical protein KHQ81_12790 [Mycoplasmatota bacterium]|nr:hypothetical protein KHQ81_12790 [Mycoplasmatota bacterium]